MHAPSGAFQPPAHHKGVVGAAHEEPGFNDGKRSARLPMQSPALLLATKPLERTCAGHYSRTSPLTRCQSPAFSTGRTMSDKWPCSVLLRTLRKRSLQSVRCPE